MDLENALLVIASVIAIFTIIILITRVFGLRTFAKMSSFDFASTIAIGSILASIIINKDQSIMKGAIALISIIAFQALFAYLIRKNDTFKKLFTNKPQFLMKDGEIFHDKLKQCNVDQGDLMAKLREANVHRLTDVKAVVFESTGDISVLHNSDDIKIDEVITEDVMS
ncbi:MAG: DUF421 domain-containing protein [Psychroflexus sp.]